MYELQLVIPAYDERDNLKPLIEKVVAAAKEFKLDPLSFNLVMVENGSHDDSREVLKQIQSTPLGDWVTVVPIEVNQGYGYGLAQGMAHTDAKVIALTHADLQTDPRDVFKGFMEIKQNPGKNLIVKGCRQGRTFKKRMVSLLFEMITQVLLGEKFREVNAQPKVFTRRLANLCHTPPKGFGFDLYLLYVASLNGFKVIDIPVFFPPRLHGESKSQGSFKAWLNTSFGFIRYAYQLSKLRGQLIDKEPQKAQSV